MAKASRNDPKQLNYTEEDMAETEEYFQNASPNSKDKESSCSLGSQKTDRADDAVTIGILPMEKDESEEEFERLLLEAIDETLSSLGEAVKNTVYFNLQNNFHMSRDEIPKKVYEFSNIIHKIFGSGAGRLETRFMKNLNSKINANVKWPGYESPLSKWVIMDITFTDYVQSMRENYKANNEKQLTANQVIQI